MRVITFGWFCKLFKAKELSGYPCNQLNFLNDIIEEIIIFGDNSTYIKRGRNCQAGRWFYRSYYFKQ